MCRVETNTNKYIDNHQEYQKRKRRSSSAQMYDEPLADAQQEEHRKEMKEFAKLPPEELARLLLEHPVDL